MKSPFPGMDPYLERHWRDVHHNLITHAQGALNEHLPPDLRARVEERVVIEPAEGNGHSAYPDLRVIETDRKRVAGTTAPSHEGNGGVAVAEPLVVTLDEPATEGYIEIIDTTAADRVVTVVEFLSQTNKLPGQGREQYLQKRRDLREGGVNLVEVDLTRTGQKLLPLSPERLPPAYRTAYQACVFRSSKPIKVEIYRVPLRERLPIIKIPLRETDQDLPLDLQALLDQCYRNARFDSIDYRVEPNPPLDPEDAAWADELLKGAGRR